MKYSDVVVFLASNPWVLALLSLLALWPLLKGLAIYGSKAWRGFFGRVSIDRSETRLASENTNFLISTLAWYTLILFASIWMSGFLKSISDALGAVAQPPVVIGLIWFNTILQFLAGVLSGTMVANIGILSVEVRKTIKSKDRGTPQ